MVKIFSKGLLRKRSLFFAFNLFLLVGCATYQDRVSEARRMLSSGKIQEALADLKKKADTVSDDQLIYVLDYATALQYAGEINQSNRYFMIADNLSEEKDYQSISRVAGSMLFNEEAVQYKGDSFEKVFINVFLALNFLQTGNFDSAMVEVRRMNQKYKLYSSDDKKDFEVNPFSRYLAGVIYEATGQMDDAFIAYRDTYKLAPDWQKLPEDILRTAILSNRQNDLQIWQKQFSDRKVEVDRSLRRSHGFVKLIYLQGWGPRKKPDSQEPLVPELVPVFSQTQKAQILVNGESKVASEVLYDTGLAAIETLRADRPSLIARRVAARIAREAVAHELSRRDETAAAGLVSFIVMQASERADLRQWSFLPATIQTAELQLPKGEYDIQIQGLDSSGNLTAENSEIRKVKIIPGKTEFIIWRSVR